MRDWGFLFGTRLLEHLDDWKSPLELARELNVPLGDVQAALDGLLRRGLVFKDGFKYIRREGYS